VARDTMGLTIADLEVLRILAQEDLRSYSAAAERAGYDRARLARLIERVNQQIGEDLDWRENRRFRPPPEVRRLILRYAAFAQDLDDLGHAPRISAGTCATFLLGQVLVALGRQLPRLAIVRSRDALQALRSDQVDVALVHGSSLGMGPSQLQRELGGGITGFALAGWEAVSIRRDEAGEPGQRERFHACWESGSLGARLNQDPGTGSATEAVPTVGLPCQSFLHAIELVRRGLIAEAVVPDLYLPKPASGLVVAKPEAPAKDQLVAVYRTAEGPRWAWLLDRSIWEQVVERPCIPR
jgi:hypothetical protein